MQWGIVIRELHSGAACYNSSRVFRFVDLLSETLASEFLGKEPLRVIFCLFPSHNKVCVPQLLYTSMHLALQAGN